MIQISSSTCSSVNRIVLVVTVGLVLLTITQENTKKWTLRRSHPEVFLGKGVLKTCRNI